MNTGQKESFPAGQPKFTMPYPPSWINRLIDSIARLPIPWWLVYVLLAIVLNGGVALVLWLTGVYGATGFHPMQVWLPTLTAYFLFFIDGINRIARSALLRFRPAFNGTGEEFAEAVYRMTTSPAKPTFIASFVLTPIMVPLGIGEFSYVQTGGLTDVPALFVALIFLLYVFSFVWTYHVIHQLREIHRLHRDFAVVRLENMRPMYALSQVASYTAIGIVLFEYGWFLAQPGLDPINPVTIGETALGIVMALVVFIWPLWGAHLKLADVKETAQVNLALRKQATRGRLQEAVEKGRFDQVSPLNTVLGALEVEAVELGKLATWPWAAGSLRNLLSAVLLPIVIWLLQYGMQKLLE